MNGEGLTLKQMARVRFIDACRELREASANKDKARFVQASLAVHAAKGAVPRGLWPLAKVPA